MKRTREVGDESSSNSGFGFGARPFLHACAYEPLGCDREEVPEFSATEEQITRNDVVAVLGEPIETIKREDGRVDVYEYDRHCVALAVALIFPFPVPYAKDQMLTVEYGQDGSFLTVEVWPGTETPEDIIAHYERQAEHRAKLEACNLPFSEAIQLDAPTQYYLGTFCPTMRSEPQTDTLHWQWACLAAHELYPDAQRRMGTLYHRGTTPQGQDSLRAYLWFSLAGDAQYALWLRDLVAAEMTPDQIADAERLVAAWEPNPRECALSNEEIHALEAKAKAEN